MKRGRGGPGLARRLFRGERPHASSGKAAGRIVGGRIIASLVFLVSYPVFLGNLFPVALLRACPGPSFSDRMALASRTPFDIRFNFLASTSRFKQQTQCMRFS